MEVWNHLKDVYVDEGIKTFWRLLESTLMEANALQVKGTCGTRGSSGVNS